MKIIPKYLLAICLAVCVQQTSYAVMGSYSPGAIQSEMQQQINEESINRELITKPKDDNAKQKKKTFEELQNELKKDVEYNPTFKLNQIIFDGNTVYKTRELQEFVSPIIGKDIQIKDVLDIAEIITKKYNYDGYVTSYAYIPEQDVIDGVITIQIVESKVDKIVVNNNFWEREAYFKYVLLSPYGVRKNKIFNVNNIDATMKAVNDIDYLKTSFTAIRNKETDNTTIEANVKDRFPVKFNVTWDDHGKYYIGEQRARLTLSQENLTGFGDKIYGGVLLSSGTTGVLSGYEIPISPWGTKLAFGYDYTNVSLGKELSNLGLSGNSSSYGLRLIQPIVKNSNTDVNASVGLNWTNTSSTLKKTKISDYSLTIIRAALSGTHDDRFGRTFAGINGDFGIDTAYSRKNISIGAPDTVFQKYSANIIRLQRVPIKGSYLIVRVGGQYSPNTLYPSEQLQLGGYNTVRGYESGTVLGDYGVNGSIELRTPVPFLETILPNKIKSFANNVKFLAFYDCGYFGSHENAYDYNTSFIHSVGTGFNFYFKNGISLNLAAGIPLTARELQNGSVRFHFALSTDIDRLIFHKFEKETL